MREETNTFIHIFIFIWKGNREGIDTPRRRFILESPGGSLSRMYIRFFPPEVVMAFGVFAWVTYTYI
jgi:hypothetical protein